MSTYRYGLNDVKIASWTSENSYGTAVDVNAAQQFQVTLETVNAELEGDDVIKDSHAKVIKGTVRVRYGDLSLTALSVMSGETPTSDASTTKLQFSESNRPYFAICGKVNGTGDGGDTHMFLPKCKVMGPITYSMQYGQYVIPELEITAVYEGTTNGIANIYEHTTATAVVIPPADPS